MALSEEERRRLEMLEQELTSSDPDLHRKLQAGAPGGTRGPAARTVYGVLIMVAGFMIVIAGIATEIIIIGVAGFLLMLVGAHVFLKDFHPWGGPGEPR